MSLPFNAQIMAEDFMNHGADTQDFIPISKGASYLHRRPLRRRSDRYSADRTPPLSSSTKTIDFEARSNAYSTFDNAHLQIRHQDSVYIKSRGGERDDGLDVGEQMANAVTEIKDLAIQRRMSTSSKGGATIPIIKMNLPAELANNKIGTSANEVCDISHWEDKNDDDEFYDSVWEDEDDSGSDSDKRVFERVLPIPAFALFLGQSLITSGIETACIQAARIPAAQNAKKDHPTLKSITEIRQEMLKGLDREVREFMESDREASKNRKRFERTERVREVLSNRGHGTYEVVWDFEDVGRLVW